MLQEIGVRFNVDMAGVPCVGDGLRDLQAAEAVGAQPMLVLTGKGEKTLRDGRLPEEHGDLSRPRVRRVGAAGGRLTRLTAMASALRSLAVRAVPADRHAALRAVGAAARSGCRRVPRYRYITRLVRAQPVGRALDLRHPQPRRSASENIPATPHIVACKHSSTWETLFLSRFLPPLAYVAKKELLSMPFFGWAFRLASPITIDRKAGQDAMVQISEQGRERFAQGFWIVVYPEGTRIRVGKRVRYKTGGARLAIEHAACRSCRSRTTPAGCGRRA